jgi:hypothetical protein
MHVANSGAAQFRGNGLSIELRVVPRSGNAPHVHNALDAVHAKEFKEIFPSASGVPNREDGKHSQLWLWARQKRVKKALFRRFWRKPALRTIGSHSERVDAVVRHRGCKAILPSVRDRIGGIHF